MRRPLWWGALALMGCGSGQLGEGRQLELDGGGPGRDSGTPGADAGPGVDVAPLDTGVPPTLSASIGTRCNNGNNDTFVVLSVAAAECAAHADALDRGADHRTVFAAFTPPSSFPAPLTLNAESCVAGACQTVPLELELRAYRPNQGAEGTYRITLIDGTEYMGELDARWCSYPAGDPPLASDVTVAQVAVYQGVKVAIIEGGAPVGNRNAPVVAGRPGVMRVFVQVEAGFRARPLLGRLELSRPNGDTIVKEVQQEIDRSSADAAFDSTFNLELEAGDLAADTEWVISILENDACTAGGGNTGGARFPAQGRQPLLAGVPGSLEVVLVPVRYQADGSNRVPDLNPAVLAAFREDLWKHYPLAQLNLSVRAQPMDWNEPILADGTGWGDFLSGLLAVRNADQPSDDTYYYGVVNAAPSREEYCPNTCIGGVSLVPDPSDSYGRGAVGIGFDHPRTFDTISHELGHAHGRQHSGCMSPDNDPSYPYTEGQIGSWGYDIVQKGYKAPALRDLMGYCTPAWVSDYTYRGLYDRIRAVNQNAERAPGLLVRYRVALSDQGRLRWGKPLHLTTAPRGRTIPVRYLGAEGQELATGQAPAREYGEDHLGQLILVGPGPLGATAVELVGYGRLLLE
ncbi:MAG: hypothetical protein IPG45_00910 [Deltaproteobacteria bacterium]|nr:hypothetical protein [Deltaproteobacteria bacterium]